MAALVSVMDSYGLRRFDSMSAEDFEASGGDVTGALDLGADASARQQAVVNAAFAETYHEGGYCAEWVMRVYERVGLGRSTAATHATSTGRGARARTCRPSGPGW